MSQIDKIEPSLFGLKNTNTNRDFTQVEAWGKNQFIQPSLPHYAVFLQQKISKQIIYQKIMANLELVRLE